MVRGRPIELNDNLGVWGLCALLWELLEVRLVNCLISWAQSLM